MITLHAPAKLNLYLKVLGRRPDGYHALDSLFHTIGLSDVLTLEDAPEGVAFTCSEPALEGPDNLAARAARRMMAVAGKRRGVRIHLDKRIPAGAGLGGGSSDAAAVLVGLDCMWGMNLGRARLAELGAELGSDVPFFVHGGCAHVTGRGEVVRPLAGTVRGWCVLVHPGRHLDTGAVFRAWAESAGNLLTQSPSEPIITTADAAAQDRVWAELGNDLQAAACRLEPEVGAALAALVRAGGARARMSGSGSAVFCITADRASATAIGERLEAPDRWRVWVVPLVCDPALSGEPQANTSV